MNTKHGVLRYISVIRLSFYDKEKLKCVCLAYIFI